MIRRLEGRSALVIGAGSANADAPGWSNGKMTAESWSVGKATAVVYARAGAVVTCVDKNLAAVFWAESDVVFAAVNDVVI